MGGWVGRASMAGSPHAGKCCQTLGDPRGVTQLMGKSFKNTLCAQAPYEDQRSIVAIQR